MAGAGTSSVAGLRLEVREFAGLTSWRWVLLDEADGAEVASHEVRLDAGQWQFEAFQDLPGWISWHAAPDTRPSDETRIVRKVGEWIGEEVLGPTAPTLANRGRRQPVTVRVIVPAEATELAFLPLALAHADGRPLSVQGVTLVTDVEDGASADGPDYQPEPVGERLRVLGLFSSPEGGQPLNLRRERYELVRLIGGIARERRAADIRVLQYGVTRESLRDILAEDEGWDVIHISGHGAPGTLMLETAEGWADPVRAAELADLLMDARGRLKLVTVATCWSATVTAADQRRLLGLPVAAQSGDVQRDGHASASPDAQATEGLGRDSGMGAASGALAIELAGRLGCAVLAMRYPVDDEFAIVLGTRLYELLADKGQPLPRAVGSVIGELAQRGESRRAFPALSVAAPALFGAAAAGLRLAAPQRAQGDNYDSELLNTEPRKMAGFPPQPERFVGRTRVMARASAALARRSGVPGVLLHGMPGGGKTACATELAYGHEHAFDWLVFYKAPDEGSASYGAAIEGSLTNFALTLERDLPGFQMAHVLTTAERLQAFLPLLTQLMEERRLLVVIDNAESLLTDDGEWRDDQWGKAIAALTDRTGLGRLILTSRRVPTGLGALERLSVDSLSADEALLLARELPHLQALSQGKVPGIQPHVARQLARRALEVALGHPKLLELANGQAADPDRLAALVNAGDQAWRKQGGIPGGFFVGGSEEAPSDEDYRDVLAEWTQTVADTLTVGERDLFWFLCCLEEGDRERLAVDAIWPHFWRELGRGGQPPDVDTALDAIVPRGLVAVRTKTADAHESYSLHPGVAAAGRAAAGLAFQGAADSGAAAYWDAMYRHASGEGNGQLDTRLLVRAGLGAIPYLTRQQHWDRAASLLDRAFVTDPSRVNAIALLPAVRQITEHKPQQTNVLTRVLQVIDPGTAETQMRAYLAYAAAHGDHEAASVAAGRLAVLCRGSGRLSEALAFADQAADYARLADLGPWSQLFSQVRRLQVLSVMGRAVEVLDDVYRFRDYMATLPTTPGPRETNPPWNVREGLLGSGRAAASLLGRWEDALDLNAGVIGSMLDRRAPTTTIARARYNDYYPLLRLGRADEALGLLQECHKAFKDANDIQMLGKTQSALASTEDIQGHSEAAIGLARDALRYKYLAGDVDAIAISHHNLGEYLRRAQHPASALANHLAAALIRTLAGVASTGDNSPADSARAAASDLLEFRSRADPPRDILDLSEKLSDIPGTDLAGVIARLSPDPQVAEDTLQAIIAQVLGLAERGQEVTLDGGMRRDAGARYCRYSAGVSHCT